MEAAEFNDISHKVCFSVISIRMPELGPPMKSSTVNSTAVIAKHNHGSGSSSRRIQSVSQHPITDINPTEAE